MTDSQEYWLELSLLNYISLRQFYDYSKERHSRFNLAEVRNDRALRQRLAKQFKPHFIKCLHVRMNPLVLHTEAMRQYLAKGRNEFAGFRNLNSLLNLNYARMQKDTEQAVRNSIQSTISSKPTLIDAAKTEYGEELTEFQLREFMADQIGDEIVIAHWSGASTDMLSVRVCYLRCPDVYDELVPELISDNLKKLPKFEQI